MVVTKSQPFLLAFKWIFLNKKAFCCCATGNPPPPPQLMKMNRTSSAHMPFLKHQALPVQGLFHTEKGTECAPFSSIFHLFLNAQDASAHILWGHVSGEDLEKKADFWRDTMLATDADRMLARQVPRKAGQWLQGKETEIPSKMGAAHAVACFNCGINLKCNWAFLLLDSAPIIHGFCSWAYSQLSYLICYSASLFVSLPSSH